MIVPTASLPTPAAPNAADTASPLLDSGQQLDTQGFLQILTAQLQAQDPLDPLNPNDFLSQLAAFSSLNELIHIRADLDSLRSLPSPPSGGTPSVSTRP
jgi:flagellar basal-body rod modification protein FlgD